MKRKVLMITTELHPKNVSVVKLLSKMPDYSFSFLFLSGKKTGKWNYRENIPITYHNCLSFHMSLPVKGDRFVLHFNPFVIFDLLKLKPDVLFLFGWDLPSYWICALYAFIFSKKLIIWVGSTKDEKSFSRSLIMPIVKWMIKGADCLLAYGSKSKGYLLSLGADKEKVIVGINTIDTRNLIKQNIRLRNKRSLLRKKYGIGKGFVFLYLGQLIERKGIQDLLNAFKTRQNRNASLLIVGDGVLRSQIKKIICLSDDKNIILHSSIQRDLIPEVLAISDLLVLPSHLEVWGLVVNEAMAFGLPVIISDKVGAGDDLIKEGINGFIFPAKNIDRLRNLLDETSSNPITMAKM